MAGLGTGLLASAAFMFMVTWILGICSTSLTDWWYAGQSSTSGRHEGLWSTCWGDNCVSTNQYSDGCKALLDTVRAFSILTILFAFFTMCLLLAMIFLGEALWLPTLICAILTIIFAILPWSIYMGFMDQCVPFGNNGKNITKGAGWCLAVSALPMAIVGLLLLGLWYCFGRGHPAAAAVPAAAVAAPVGAACVPAGGGYYYGGAPTYTYAAPAYGAGYATAAPAVAPTYGASYATAAAPTYGASYATAAAPTYGASYPMTYTTGSYAPAAAATYTAAAPPPAYSYYNPGSPYGSPMLQI